MDWATFFKDYGQSLFTLGGVFLGSAITFLINFLNLRFQSRERDKDRQEQRKEAKTQLALELMRNDVKTVDDAINNSFKALNFSRSLAFRRDVGKLSHDEMLDELKSTLAGDSDTLRPIEIDYLVDTVAFTFGDDFYSHFEAWQDAVGEYSDLMLSQSAHEEKNETLDELWSKIISATGKLHIMLREKLISIRDS